MLILDGYTDEPAGLGVPPYIDVYPRYIAGAIWSARKDVEIKYLTVDEARVLDYKFFAEANKYDLVVVIAGVTVPGKYLGGKPITVNELSEWFRIIDKPYKALVGPAAKFGIGIEGGKVAELPTKIKENFDMLVKGDPEVVIHEIIKEDSLEKVNPYTLRRNYKEIEEFILKGARIVTQHPNYGKNLIVEIETYRGCPRVITGGCSFCIEPLYGLPVFRDQRGIVREVEKLYKLGVRFFRIGRQPDIFVYKSREVGKKEFPKPEPSEIEKLFKGIRTVAPSIKTLHIDNVNPGTVANNPKESLEVAKIIIKYHTPGDVAAFGVESVDPKVVKLNNLKVTMEEALEAIRVINKVGNVRGYNGLPELLPGVNLLFGLKGETKETYEINFEFLKRIVDEGLLIRRINIRQVMVFPATKMWNVGDKVVRKHKKFFKVFKEKVKKEIELPLMKRLVPAGTILREVYTEKHMGNYTYARQVGSYPLIIKVPEKLKLGVFMDFTVVDHDHRSVYGVPYPLRINEASPRLIALIPGISRKDCIAILKKRPFKNIEELSKVISNNYSLKFICI